MDYSKFSSLSGVLCKSDECYWDAEIDPSNSRSVFALTSDADLQCYNENEHISYFIYSAKTLENQWGHPFLFGNLISNCTGDERICSYLKNHHSDLFYSDPHMTALFGMGFIAMGERSGRTQPIKYSLQTAFILSHMATQSEDPSILTDDEKQILSRMILGNVSVEERVEIYRKTISKTSIDTVIQMPSCPHIKTELFQIIKEDAKC